MGDYAGHGTPRQSSSVARSQPSPWLLQHYQNGGGGGGETRGTGGGSSSSTSSYQKRRRGGDRDRDRDRVRCSFPEDAPMSSQEQEQQEQQRRHSSRRWSSDDSMGSGNGSASGSGNYLNLDTGLDVLMKRDREREGRCAECGAQTHEVSRDPTTGKRRKEPLTIENEVHRGRCLLCRPLPNHHPHQGGGMRRFSSSLSVCTTSTGGGSVYSEPNQRSCISEPARARSQHGQHVVESSSFSTASAGGGHHGHAHHVPTWPPSSPRIDPYSANAEAAEIEEALSRIERESADLCDVIAAMRRFPRCKEVQEKGCEKLWVQSWEDETSSAIGRVGGISTILDAMRTHASDPHLQKCGCEALQNLALNEYNRDVIVEQGGIVAIIDAMNRHSNLAEVQQCGCTALANVAADSADHKVAIAESGGILAVMKAVENFPNAEPVLRAAFQALRVLGYNPGAVMRGEGGGAPPGPS